MSPKPTRKEKQAYAEFARKHVPRQPIVRNVLAAFFTGGVICLVGQAILNFYIFHGIKPPDSGGPLAGTMILIGAVLTGFGVYDYIGKFGGMGSALPITGFANSIVAPAMEFKREGYVLGLGAKMFSVAGPVIVYGVVTATFVALLMRYFGRL